MKGTHLGEFEELVLLFVGVLFPEAYGVSLRKEIESQTGRTVAIGAIHSALVRLEEKGFLKSALAEGTHERGGRRKRIFTITAEGKAAIALARDLRNTLWDKIPELAWRGMSYGFA